MEQLDEFAKDVVDRYIRSMGYNPQTIDRNKRMALTKTIRFQQFAQRMQHEALEFPGDDGVDPKGSSSKVVGERRKEMSKSARMIKAIYKKHRVVKEELYDHEKDDKDGGTYGQKPKLAKGKNDQQDGQADEGKNKASAVLTGGTTLTGQKRDDVEFDPMLSKPNNKSDSSGMQIKKKDK
mgnify:CR=1 FL=1